MRLHSKGIHPMKRHYSGHVNALKVPIQNKQLVACSAGVFIGREC